MRRGAANTSRALAEQATATEEIGRSAAELHRLISGTTKAMTEQASAINEISAAAEGMRVQSEQVSRATADQAKTMRGMTSESQNVAKQITLIAKANVEHSAAAADLLVSVNEVRRITDRNAAGVKQTRGGTDDLRRRAQALAALVERPAPARKSNGTRPQRVPK
jgi:methyl-accepting chemotaxis protein